MVMHKVLLYKWKRVHEQVLCRQTNLKKRYINFVRNNKNRKQTLVFRSRVNFCKSVLKIINAGISIPYIEIR